MFVLYVTWPYSWTTYVVCIQLPFQWYFKKSTLFRRLHGKSKLLAYKGKQIHLRKVITVGTKMPERSSTSRVSQIVQSFCPKVLFFLLWIERHTQKDTSDSMTSTAGGNNPSFSKLMLCAAEYGNVAKVMKSWCLFVMVSWAKNIRLLLSSSGILDVNLTFLLLFGVF